MKDGTAWTVIELTLSESEAGHITGYQTAVEMWEALRIVKEGRGQNGLLRACCTFFRATMLESDYLVQHIAKMRRYKEDLEAMDSSISDDNFAIALLAPLLDLWDLFTSSYLEFRSDSKVRIPSGEMIKALIEENTCCQEHETPDTVLMAQPKRKLGLHKTGNKGATDQSQVVCHNCGKAGHMVRVCWSKGGGKEGQGPKKFSGRSKSSALKVVEVDNVLKQLM